MHCDKCEKPTELCVCSMIQPKATRIHVLILQHPQEPDKDLGSARLAHLALPNSTLKIGLSWRNLSSALGRETQNSKWAVLYLGSGTKTPDTQRGKISAEKISRAGLLLVDKKAVPLPDQEKLLKELEGIVILDGTWSQAKALWWRNAWLLKLRRAILTPKHPSLYRELRREPRRECLSTIESIAESLDALHEPEIAGAHLRQLFGELLNRQRQRLKDGKNAAKNPSR